jgi:hypothetical protein
MGFSTLGVVEVPPELKVQPKLDGSPEVFGKPKCRTRRDTTTTIHQFVDALVRNADAKRKVSLRHTHRLEKLQEQDLAGVSRFSVSWNTNHCRS